MAGSPELSKLQEIDRPFSMRLVVTPKSAFLIEKDIVLGALNRRNVPRHGRPNLLIGHKREDVILQVDPNYELGIRRLPELLKDYGTLIVQHRGDHPIFIGDRYMVEYSSRAVDRLGLIVRSSRPIGNATEIDGMGNYANVLRSLHSRE